MSRSIRNHRTLFGALMGAVATLALVLGLGVSAGAGGAASAAAPVNTSPPTVTGTPQVGHKLTGDRGVWSESPTDYNYFWTRCDSTGGSCANISGANATTYTLTSADVGNTLRFKVQATNAGGSTFASSARTAVITSAAKPPPPPAVNHAPTIRILSARFVGARIYVQMRVCDDSYKNLTIIARDSKNL